MGWYYLSFPNFKCCAVAIWDWLNNFIILYNGSYKDLRMMGSKLIHVRKNLTRRQLGQNARYQIEKPHSKKLYTWTRIIASLFKFKFKSFIVWTVPSTIMTRNRFTNIYFTSMTWLLHTLTHVHAHIYHTKYTCTYNTNDMTILYIYIFFYWSRCRLINICE